MRPSLVARATAIAMLLAPACGRSPSSPTPTAPQPGAALSTLAISGPARVPPGATAAYKAAATYTDGTTKDVTAEVTWSPTSIGSGTPIYFTGPGTAVTGNRGQRQILVHLGSQKGVLDVLVLELGTFKLIGSVVETSGRLLSGVSVEVLYGIGRGLRATTDTQGRYALYGVAGQIRLRASTPGLDTEERDVLVSSDGSADPVILSPLEQPAPINGTWNMSLAPAPGCPAGPGDLIRDRRYEVTLAQQGTGLKLTIASPTLSVYNPTENCGTVYGSQVFFTFIGDTDYGDWSSADILDHISPTQTFEFDGDVNGTVAGGEIRGVLSGDLMYYEGTSRNTPTWYCRAKDHSITLRR